MMAKRTTPGGGKGRISRIGDLSWSLVEIAGGWAETSERLTADERAELVRLRKKAANASTQLNGAERAKYTSLVARALGTERIRELLDRRPESRQPAVPPSPRETSDVDAAARLERAARLRDNGVITEQDFQQLKARYLEEL
jgi:hypothetical protein